MELVIMNTGYNGDKVTEPVLRGMVKMAIIIHALRMLTTTRGLGKGLH